MIEKQSRVEGNNAATTSTALNSNRMFFYIIKETCINHVTSSKASSTL